MQIERAQNLERGLLPMAVHVEYRDENSELEIEHRGHAVETSPSPGDLQEEGEENLDVDVSYFL